MIWLKDGKILLQRGYYQGRVDELFYNLACR
jgi:hypothetical protein